MSENTKQLNVKVSDEMVDIVERAALILRRTKSQIVEDAVREYAESHHLSTLYRLHQKNGILILLKLDGGGGAEVVEVTALNGVPAKKIAEEYSLRLNQRVALVEEQ